MEELGKITAITIIHTPVPSRMPPVFLCSLNGFSTVHKIDEYVVEEKSKRSSSKASSMESVATLVEESQDATSEQQQELESEAGASVPSAGAYTPSIVISGRSTQQGNY